MFILILYFLYVTIRAKISENIYALEMLVSYYFQMNIFIKNIIFEYI